MDPSSQPKQPEARDQRDSVQGSNATPLSSASFYKQGQPALIAALEHCLGYDGHDQHFNLLEATNLIRCIPAGAAWERIDPKLQQLMLIATESLLGRTTSFWTLRITPQPDPQMALQLLEVIVQRGWYRDDCRTTSTPTGSYTLDFCAVAQHALRAALREVLDCSPGAKRVDTADALMRSLQQIAPLLTTEQLSEVSNALATPANR